MTGDPPRGSVDVHLRALDTSILVRISGSGAEPLAEQVRRAWSRCLSADTAADVCLQLVHDPDPALVETGRAAGYLADVDMTRLMHALSPRVTTAAIDHQAGRLLMLHACGVADTATGRTLALVGPSGTGKTTASRALCQRFGYVTDETVAIRPDATIAVYPKPLSVIVEGSSWKEQVSVDDIGLTRAPERCTLARIVVLDRDGSKNVRVEQVPVVRALAMLAPESSYLARMDRPLHRLAAAVEGGGGLQVIHYADRAQLGSVVESLLRPA